MGNDRVRASVVMPVFNGARHLAECLDSVLGQTLRDFEFVIVDDGSSDDSWNILSAYARRDDRLRLERHAANRGHHEASNHALGLARGAFIFRMDQDDLAMPRRLEATIAFFDSHPDIDMVSTSYIRRREDGTEIVRRSARNHTELRAALVFGNCICHPSVAVRRGVAQTGELHYENLPGPQDYDLWVRLLGRVRGATLREPLVVYREHGATMSALFADDMPKAAREISDRQLRALLPAVSDSAFDVLRRLESLRRVGSADYAYTSTLLDVFDQLKREPDLDDRTLDEIRRRWLIRAASTLLFGNGSARPGWRFFATMARRDRAAFQRWVSADVPSRLRRRLRHSMRLEAK